MTASLEINIADPQAGSRPPAVLQVVPSLVSGGVERGTVEIAQALVNGGWQSVVVSRRRDRKSTRLNSSHH